MKPILSSFTPGFKIASLFLFMLIGLVTAVMLTNVILMIPGVEKGGKVVAIYLGLAMQSVFVTTLPACLIVALTHSAPFHYMKMSADKQIGKKLLFAVLIFVVSYFLTSFLSQWNKGMTLPGSMRELELALRSMEDAALETTNLLLSGKSPGTLLLNLLILAGFAALSEEIFFRGVLQQFVQEKIRNAHTAVWVTALVFSLIHFQFYGFLPRLLLGALLGYLFLYTQNLWAPVLFHFMNNAIIILLNYFFGNSQWMKDMEMVSVNGAFLLVAVFSAIFTFLLFRIYLKRNPETTKTGKIAPET